MERINKALSPKVADQKLKKIEPIKITVGNSHNKKTIQVQNGSNGSSNSPDQYGPPLPPTSTTPTQNRLAPKHGHGSPLAVSTPAVRSPDGRQKLNNGKRPKKNFEEDLDMFETAEDPFDTFGTTTTPPKSSKLKIETKVTPKVTQTNPLTGTPVGPGRSTTRVAADRKAELSMDSPNKTPSIPSPVPKPIPRVQSDAGKSDFWTKG